MLWHKAWLETRVRFLICNNAFTLALPFAQAVTLIVVPWIAVLVVSGGLVFFAIALLSASLVQGEYMAPLVAFCPVVAAAVLLQDPSVQASSPLRFMAGDGYFDKSRELFAGPIPWLHAGLHAGGWVLVATALLAASVKAIPVREF